MLRVESPDPNIWGCQRIFSFLFAKVFHSGAELVQVSLSSANRMKHHGNKHHAEQPSIMRTAVQVQPCAKSMCSHKRNAKCETWPRSAGRVSLR